MNKQVKSIKFGGDFDLEKGGERISTIEARLLFLQMIAIYRKPVAEDLLRLIDMELLPKSVQMQAELQREVFDFYALHLVNPVKFSTDTENLFGISESARNTPLLEFIKFIYANRKADETIPYQWSKLNKKKEAKKLCAAIQKWAEKWNLTDEWCLDFAIEVLRCFQTKFLEQWETDIKNDDLDQNFFLVEFVNWQSNIQGWVDAISSISQVVLAEKFVSVFDENPPVFNFQRNGIEITDSCSLRSETAKDFKERINAEFNKQLKALQKTDIPIVVGLKTNFNEKLKKYIKNLQNIYGEKNSKNTRKNTGEIHFRWLIEFQIPPVRTYSEIAEKSERDIKTIKEGIENVANLLKLNRRRTVGGRPKGAKDKLKRNYRR